MCGRFAQYQSRELYFDALGVSDSDYFHDPEPIGRYNVAPGTNLLLLLNQRDPDRDRMDTQRLGHTIAVTANLDITIPLYMPDIEVAGIEVG